MKRIAIYCVTYHSDKERDLYLASVERAAKKAGDKVCVDTFIANNTDDDNPGYFGAIRRLMQEHDPSVYDYSIISNVDLTMEEDFLAKLADYDCAEDTGWIAPQIWSDLEKRDRNPRQTSRYTLGRLKILRLFYRIPLLDTLYTKTLYRRKQFVRSQPGTVYSGNTLSGAVGSTIPYSFSARRYG